MLERMIGHGYDESQPDFIEKEADYHRRLAQEAVEREQRQLTPNVRKQTIVRYVTMPDGQTELVGYQINRHKDFDLMRAMPRAKRGESENREKSLSNSCQRARKNLRLKVKAIRGDHMLTLTYRENVIDRDRVAKDFKEFVRRVNKLKSKALRKLDYVAVLEQQERGAWHIHCAVHGWQHVQVLRAIWLEVVGKDNGNIDVQGPRSQGAKRVRGVHQIADYLSKYIDKDGEDVALNKKRYWASKGIVVPERVTLGTWEGDDLDDALAYAFKWLAENCNLQGVAAYVSRGRECFWFATADRWYAPDLPDGV
ncbi:conserved protein of unknown function [Cupriavidus taiwanensis]|uniref:Replication-associated protein ORF2/G2P domain-containing protein n=1 Tax=Cupriavidus taiwanensis TaxID=164546 RepID=A0A375IGT6_9BURK|nr:hypothetical protein [Cupriavidus taiwanensis]SPK73201.1 conserved protein of unknown function [Cupriavidus taiwanensis]